MIVDADADQTDHRHEIVRVKETGMMKETGTATEMEIAAATMIIIVAETVILTATMITIAAEVVIVTTTAVLSPVLIPDHLTIRDADVTISNSQNAALSFWLTEGKGNAKLFFGTSLE